MDGKVIGLAVGGTKVNEVQQSIYKAEEYGIQAAWMTTGGARLDSMTMFAAAASGTKNLKLGTSVVPIFPRHPLVMVQQAQVVAQLAPGRFRLGIGPSHRPTMRAMGIKMPSPLENLREYLRILKGLLQDGEVDYQGACYQVKDRLAERVNVPVMASALQRGSFELCGAEADGAISWVSPAAYLRDVGLPAMRAGAEQADRPVPPLIAHVPVCVHDDESEVRSAFREQFSNYPTLPFYRRMLISAGYLTATKDGGPGADNHGGTAILIRLPCWDITLNSRLFVSEQRQYKGSLGATYPDKHFPMSLRWHREGKFQLDKLVTQRYELDEINDACHSLKSGNILGRAIIEY